VQQSREDRLSFFKIASTRIGGGFTLRGYAARLPHLAKLLGEREAQKQQSPPGAGRDAGRNRGIRSLSQDRISPKSDLKSSGKTQFSATGRFAPISRPFFRRVAL
jgi:hypothetical protein